MSKLPIWVGNRLYSDDTKWNLYVQDMGLVGYKK